MMTGIQKERKGRKMAGSRKADMKGDDVEG